MSQVCLASISAPLLFLGPPQAKTDSTKPSVPVPPSQGRPKLLLLPPPHQAQPFLLRDWTTPPCYVTCCWQIHMSCRCWRSETHLLLRLYWVETLVNDDDGAWMHLYGKFNVFFLSDRIILMSFQSASPRCYWSSSRIEPEESRRELNCWLQILLTWKLRPKLRKKSGNKKGVRLCAQPKHGLWHRDRKHKRKAPSFFNFFFLFIFRQHNIEENMTIAMEEAPESFGQVVMLYINCKVNGHPVKAFVDSGSKLCLFFLEVFWKLHYHSVRFVWKEMFFFKK